MCGGPRSGRQGPGPAAAAVGPSSVVGLPPAVIDALDGSSAAPRAAIPMESPYCSCKL